VELDVEIDLKGKLFNIHFNNVSNNQIKTLFMFVCRE